MKNKSIACAIASIIFIAGCAGPETRIHNIADAVTSSEETHDTEAINNLSDSIKSADLSLDRLHKYSDETINILYDTLSKISFYSPDEEAYVLRQETVFNEKVRRGRYNEEDVEDMGSTFLEARIFNKAINLKQQFPKMALSSIPESIVTENIPQSANWQVYDISDQGNKAELRLLPLATGVKIIMFASPGCGPAESAAKDILADVELNSIFRAAGIMVIRKFDPAGVEAMKKQFNFPAVYIAHKSGDFPGLILQPSPHFYFLKDGKSLYDFKSWSSENNGEYSKKKIKKGLSAIGLKAE